MVAIVTGGAKGIGRAIVVELAKKGIQVVLNYRHSEKQAIKAKQELLEHGYEIEIYQADVAKKEEVQRLVAYTKEKWGEVDILVNNAGIDKWQLFTDMTDEDWNEMLANNLTSAFYMTKEVVPDMIRKKKGCIINISSIWGITGASCEVAYSVSKAGMDGLTKALAKELAPSNIRVNSIAPGAIDTDMNQNLNKEERKEVENEIPLGRFGTPEDIAKCVMWLVEDNYTTGQIVSPNGGWVI
ncbi:MAG: SDR family oxidoreductase [Clostridia bacterium]|nr:SDR family oxidoreductase [Clostridia bacterium]